MAYLYFGAAIVLFLIGSTFIAIRVRAIEKTGQVIALDYVLLWPLILSKKGRGFIEMPIWIAGLAIFVIAAMFLVTWFTA
jgi:hypothetical protein